jgi:hypothetical protein
MHISPTDVFDLLVFFGFVLPKTGAPFYSFKLHMRTSHSGCEHEEAARRRKCRVGRTSWLDRGRWRFLWAAGHELFHIARRQLPANQLGGHSVDLRHDGQSARLMDAGASARSRALIWSKASTTEAPRNSASWDWYATRYRRMIRNLGRRYAECESFGKK